VPTPAAAPGLPSPAMRLAPGVCDAPGAQQDRRACCGTMNLAEYYNIERVLDAEAEALARWCAEHGRNGPAGEDLPPAPAPDPSQATAAVITTAATAAAAAAS